MLGLQDDVANVARGALVRKDASEPDLLARVEDAEACSAVSSPVGPAKWVGS